MRVQTVNAIEQEKLIVIVRGVERESSEKNGSVTEATLKSQSLQESTFRRSKIYNQN